MKNFVAISLQFVASCKGLVVATCNELQFWRPLTYESLATNSATKGRFLRGFVAVLKNFVAAVADFVAVVFQPLFAGKAEPTK